MTAPSVKRHTLSVWLPRLPTDRLLRHRGEAGPQGTAGSPDGPGPRVTYVREGGALRLAAVDPAAAARGLGPGTGLADARAMHPDLVAVEADPAADAAFCAAIADWACRWTPLVGIDAAEGFGLMLDISGCAHLFGGVGGMYRDVLRRLRAQGLHAAAAVADTPGAAWALARFGPPSATGRVVEAAAIDAALRPLPLAALRLPAATVEAMRRVGLLRIGDIADLPRPPLAARFGEVLLRRLDQAFGRVAETISPRRPPPVFLAERRLLDPVFADTAILRCVERLGCDLAEAMATHGVAARRVELALFRVDGRVRHLMLGASRPLRDGAAMRRLFAERLAGLADPLDPGFGFDVIRLSIPEAERAASRQAELPAEGEGQGEGQGRAAAEAALAQFVDQVTARFGPGCIRRIAACDTHQPERAAPLVPWSQDLGKAPADIGADPDLPPRPLRLLDPPQPIQAMAEIPDGPPLSFRWQGRLHVMAHGEGPERIAPEWWHGAFHGPCPPTRDYFRVEDRDGRRFWLFREGLWDREADSHGRPRWYLHGLFA